MDTNIECDNSVDEGLGTMNQSPRTTNNEEYHRGHGMEPDSHTQTIDENIAGLQSQDLFDDTDNEDTSDEHNTENVSDDEHDQNEGNGTLTGMENTLTDSQVMQVANQMETEDDNEQETARRSTRAKKGIDYKVLNDSGAENSKKNKTLNGTKETNKNKPKKAKENGNTMIEDLKAQINDLTQALKERSKMVTEKNKAITELKKELKKSEHDHQKTLQELKDAKMILNS